MHVRTWSGLLFVGMLVILTAGCATHTRKMVDLRPKLAAGDYEGALGLVDSKMGGAEALLADLERGLILHQAGRWQESNTAFEAAERQADELYGTSISENVIALFTNDQGKDYRARPFEMAMVPYYRALNYLYLGERDAAMVEARKASLLLSSYIDVTLGAIQRGDSSKLARTRNDPFLLYISAMLYDWDGELNDAFIAYRNAAVAYEDLAGLLGVTPPPWLGRDLERVAARLGFESELDQVRASCPAVFQAADWLPDRGRAEGRGELVLLVENGWVASKGQETLNLPIYESDSYDDQSHWALAISSRQRDGVVVVNNRAKVAYWLTLALPTLPRTSSEPVRAVLHDADGQAVRSVRAHHPSANAHITAEAEAGMVLLRTVARALAKYLAYNTAQKESKGLGLLLNVFNVASEVADTRSWLTLPDEVQLVRVSLPEGVHELEMRLEDTSGRTLGTVLLPPVTIVAGDWTFLNHRVYD